MAFYQLGQDGCFHRVHPLEARQLAPSVEGTVQSHPSYPSVTCTISFPFSRHPSVNMFRKLLLVIFGVWRVWDSVFNGKQKEGEAISSAHILLSILHQQIKTSTFRKIGKSSFLGLLGLIKCSTLIFDLWASSSEIHTAAALSYVFFAIAHPHFQQIINVNLSQLRPTNSSTEVSTDNLCPTEVPTNVWTKCFERIPTLV